MFAYIIFILIDFTFAKLNDVDKTELCAVICDDNKNVCGLRVEEDGFRLKLFQNICELIQYGCNEYENAYGLINTEFCENPKKLTYEENIKIVNDILLQHSEDNCFISCNKSDTNEVCGIRQDGIGFRIRLFQSKCELFKHNCKNNTYYNETDIFICKDLSRNENNKSEIVNIEDNVRDSKRVSKDLKHIVVVNSKMFEGNDMNESIDQFFSASHIYDLPIKEVNLNTRRRIIKNVGPVKVFVPWIVIPKNISDDKYHAPTLSSCYHKCPTTCPDTYAPVCGVPGIVAREPSLMFQNHCFMDVAQCKMFWEGKSSTAHSSSYVETSFLFCMGDEMNAVYRFLPAIRTLQRMGRLKKKGKFRYRLNNFRFISEFRSGHPKFMG